MRWLGTVPQVGNCPGPQELAAEAITDLEAGVDDLREIVALVKKEEGLTTDCADDTDGKKTGRKSSVKSV